MKRAARLAAIGAMGAVSTSLAMSARAEPAASTVALGFEGCTALDAASVKRLVRVDLGQDPVPLDFAPAGSGIPKLVVRCAGDALSIELAPPDGARSLQRILHLASAAEQAGDVRERLVALAALELLAESRIALGPVAPPERAEISAPAPGPISASSGESGLRVDAFLGGRRFVAAGADVPTLALMATVDRSPLVGASVDLEAAARRDSTALGPVSSSLFSLGPAVDLHRRLSWATLRVGTGPRLGLARMSGEPIPSAQYEGRAFWAPWAGWRGLATVSVSPARWITLSVMADGGYVVWPVSGRIADGSSARLEGLWIGAYFGLGLAL